MCLDISVSMCEHGCKCAFVCTHVPESRWGDGPGSAPGLTCSHSCPTLCRALSRVTITASDSGLALLATCMGQSWPRGVPRAPHVHAHSLKPTCGCHQSWAQPPAGVCADVGAHLLLPPLYAHSPLSYFLLYSLLPISFLSFLSISEF